MSDIQNWYYADSAGQQIGPITSEQLQDFVNRQIIFRETYVWTESLSEWVPASKVGGLFGALNQSTSQQQSQEVAPIRAEAHGSTMAQPPLMVASAPMIANTPTTAPLQPPVSHHPQQAVPAPQLVQTQVPQQSANPLLMGYPPQQTHNPLLTPPVQYQPAQEEVHPQHAIQQQAAYHQQVYPQTQPGQHVGHAPTYDQQQVQAYPNQYQAQPLGQAIPAAQTPQQVYPQAQQVHQAQPAANPMATSAPLIIPNQNLQQQPQQAHQPATSNLLAPQGSTQIYAQQQTPVTQFMQPASVEQLAQQNIQPTPPSQPQIATAPLIAPPASAPATHETQSIVTPASPILLTPNRSQTPTALLTQPPQSSQTPTALLTQPPQSSQAASVPTIPPIGSNPTSISSTEPESNSKKRIARPPTSMTNPDAAPTRVEMTLSQQMIKAEVTGEQATSTSDPLVEQINAQTSKAPESQSNDLIKTATSLMAPSLSTLDKKTTNCDTEKNETSTPETSEAVEVTATSTETQSSDSTSSSSLTSIIDSLPLPEPKSVKQEKTEVNDPLTEKQKTPDTIASQQLDQAEAKTSTKLLVNSENTSTNKLAVPGADAARPKLNLGGGNDEDNKPKFNF